MLKNKRILLTILVALMLLLVPSIVKAADGEANVTSVEVTTPTGIYGVGQEVIIRVNFDKALKGVMPKLQIYFGGADKKELTVSEVTTPVNYIDYKYNIASGDNGKVMLSNIDTIDAAIYDELGNSLTINKIYDLTGNTVMADTTIVRADLSNAEFEWIGIAENSNRHLELKLTNSTKIEGYRYYVHLSHNKNEQLNALDYSNQSLWRYLSEYSTFNAEDIVAENGDIYISICEVDSAYGVPKILISGQKIERKAQLPLGGRLKAYFFNDHTATFCHETIGGYEREINVKIGIITDKSILKAIKNGEANALQRLLDYAKTSESFYDGTVKLGEDVSVVSNLHFIDQEYYFVYMELEDENGKFYPVEDVSLYQALVDETVGNNLFDYLDESFEWNLEDDEKPQQKPESKPTPEPEKKPTNTKDETKAPGKLPYTGGTFVIIAAVLTIIALGIYAYRRNNDLKGI